MTVDDNVEFAIVPIAVQVGAECGSVCVEFPNGEFFSRLAETSDAFLVTNVAVADLVRDGLTPTQNDALFGDDHVFSRTPVECRMGVPMSLE